MTIRMSMHVAVVAAAIPVSVVLGRVRIVIAADDAAVAVC